MRVLGRFVIEGVVKQEAAQGWLKQDREDLMQGHLDRGRVRFMQCPVGGEGLVPTWNIARATGQGQPRCRDGINGPGSNLGSEGDSVKLTSKIPAENSLTRVH